MSPARNGFAAILALLGSSPTLGQAAGAPDSEIARLRTDFDYGKYPEVLQRATSRIDRGNLSEGDVVDLHKYAGLSAFYLHKTPEAERHLWALLQLDPDHTLDPFVVPPPALDYFESLRKEHAQELAAIRDERRRRTERMRTEAEERDRARADAEIQRRRIEELSREVSDAPIPKRSLLLDFVPFGVGQFQQGRSKAGLLFGVSEGALAATSIAAYLVYSSLIQERPVMVDDRLTPDRTFTFVERGIPPEHHRQASVLRTVKYASAGAFWLVYAIGVGDALIHHRDHLISAAPATTAGRETGSPAVGAARASRSFSPEGLQAFVAPSSGGVSAGVRLKF